MDLNKYWWQLCEFDMRVGHDCHFTILGKTYNNYVDEFFLRPNIKELNLWI